MEKEIKSIDAYDLQKCTIAITVKQKFLPAISSYLHDISFVYVGAEALKGVFERERVKIDPLI